MTDKEQLEEIATILGVNELEIGPRVREHRRQGISKLFARTKPFWIKSRAELDLSVGDYLINLKANFPDLWQLRHIRSTSGKLEIMSEGRFRAQFADDSVTGKPTIAIPLDADNLQLYPRADTSLTLFASYFFSPSRETIDSVHAEWQFVITDYIVAMLWPDLNQKVVMLQFFQKGLDDIRAMAKPLVEDDIDIESDPLARVLFNDMKEER